MINICQEAYDIGFRQGQQLGIIYGIIIAVVVVCLINLATRMDTNEKEKSK